MYSEQQKNNKSHFNNKYNYASFRSLHLNILNSTKSFTRLYSKNCGKFNDMGLIWYFGLPAL